MISCMSCSRSYGRAIPSMSREERVFLINYDSEAYQQVARCLKSFLIKR